MDRLVAALVLAVLLFCAPARAAETARLTVVRADSARDCPDDRGVRDAVAARLGYEPFVTEAARHIEVTFARESGDLRGVVRVRDAAGAVVGERELTSTRGDCDELASSTTLTISILLDPKTGAARRAPDAILVPAGLEPPGTPRDVRSVGANDGEKPVPPRSPPVQLLIGLGGLAAVGVAPAPSLGARFGVGIARQPWSIRAELRAEAAASASAEGARTARTSLLAGSLVPCGHVGVIVGCAVVTLGALRGEVVEASPSRQATLHALVGPRVGVLVPLTSWLLLDAHVEGAWAVTSTTLRVAQSDVWTTPDLSGLFALGIASRFP